MTLLPHALIHIKWAPREVFWLPLLRRHLSPPNSLE